MPYRDRNCILCRHITKQCFQLEVIFASTCCWLPYILGDVMVFYQNITQEYVTKSTLSPCSHTHCDTCSTLCQSTGPSANNHRNWFLCGNISKYFNYLNRLMKDCVYVPIPLSQRLGAEEQHLPLATPMEGREEGGGVKEEEEMEQEDQSSRFLVECSVSKTTPHHSSWLAVHLPMCSSCLKCVGVLRSLSSL